MTDRLTNRDLYLRLLRVGQETSRTLEECLRALWLLASAERDRDALPPDLFVTLLTEAESAPVPPFDEAWRTADFSLGKQTGFERWETVILSQIADLREFAEHPTPPWRELGVEAPRPPGTGARATFRTWYNHTPAGYLECAMAGMFGGWDLDDGVRRPVSGPAVSLYPEPEGVTNLESITWTDFTEFLDCGQTYE